MSLLTVRPNQTIRIIVASSLLLCPAIAVLAQAQNCPAVPETTATPADKAYNLGRYENAEDLYQAALNQHPGDVTLSADLIHSLLHEGKVTQAATLTTSLLAANPHSAPALTSLAEVQLRQGEPWTALATLDEATAADPCYARTHLIRARALRIDSMYEKERNELQAAYDIDPADHDIQFAWLSIVSSAHDVLGTTQALATTKDLDDETRHKAEANVQTLLPMLSENSQTCHAVPGVTSTSLPMQPLMADAKHITGYRLDVDLPQTRLKLLVDTAASGLFITKAAADQNGFKPMLGDPPGTVRADKIRIGPLEFQDCMVGVSDTPFPNKADGFIGTDVFSSWLITIDNRLARLNLAPLPPEPSVVPVDRSTAPELAGYTPIYRRRQYLIVPITFSNNSRRLFILSSGMMYTSMTSAAAHSLSKMTVNFTNSEQTAQGTKVNFFREVFDMQLGNLPEIHQGHILEFDPNTVSRNAGMQISGMIGLDILQPLTLHIDYRDGLVKFENPSAEPGHAPPPSTMIASTSPAAAADATSASCAPDVQRDRPVNSTIQARVTGSIDASHLKPGKEFFVKVVYGMKYPTCTLDAESIIYGHVLSASASKGPGPSDVSVVFDHGECTGKARENCLCT